MADENPIPKEWRDQGFSGHFTVMLEAKDNDSGGPPSAEQLEKLRAMVPYSPFGGWLALAVEDIGGTAHIVMVRKDENAIVDLVTGPRAGT
jgi:hypothetical protein